MTRIIVHNWIDASFMTSEHPRASNSGQFVNKGGGGVVGARPKAAPEPDKGVNFGLTEAKAFIAGRNKSKRSGYLSPLEPGDLAGKHVFTSNGGKVGVVVDRDGDIQNVFNNGGPRGAGADAVAFAVSKGGRTLDCYDGFLPNFYHQLGFEETSRMKFNPEYAPDGWDFARDDNPDVVFMHWNGYGNGGEKAAIERAKAGPAAYSPHAKSADVATDWDEAKRASRGKAVD